MKNIHHAIQITSMNRYVKGAYIPNPMSPANVPAISHWASPVLPHPIFPWLFTPNPSYNPAALPALTAATLVHPGMLAAGARAAPSLASKVSASPFVGNPVAAAMMHGAVFPFVHPVVHGPVMHHWAMPFYHPGINNHYLHEQHWRAAVCTARRRRNGRVDRGAHSR